MGRRASERGCRICSKVSTEPSLPTPYSADLGRRLSKSRKFQHSGVEEHGENIFVSTEDVSYEHAVQSWLAEETNYEGEKFGEGNAAKYARFSKHASFCTTMCTLARFLTDSQHNACGRTQAT